MKKEIPFEQLVKWCEYRRQDCRSKRLSPNRTEELETKFPWWKEFCKYREFLPFEKSKEFVHKLELKTQKEWNKRKKIKRMDNIPANPYSVYKKEWISWGDWLGNENIYKKIFPPFEEARSFVWGLKLNGKNEYTSFFKNKKLKNLPSSPSVVYKKEWTGWSNWVGTEYLPFEEARSFVWGLKLNGKNEWLKYCKSGKNPSNIPKYPNAVYKNKGWISFPDWLGTKPGFTRKYPPFKKARKAVWNLKLKSKFDWGKYCKSRKSYDLSDFITLIPTAPRTVYKDEWISWGDWLGTGYIACQNRKYLTFKNAKKFAHNLHLKTINDWRKYIKSGKPPDNIPARPDHQYKNNDWISWADWLGKNK